MANTYGFSVACACGCGSNPLMVVQGADLQAWRQVAIKGEVTDITCPDCGCAYTLGDGTSQITTVCKSRPSIDSIGTATGPKAGGTSVAVVGHAFDIGTPVMRFEGAAGTNLAVQDATHLTIKTPVAPLVRVRVDWGTLVGVLGQDAVTGSASGETGTIAGGIGSNILLLTGLTGPLTASEWLEKDANNKVQIAAANIYAPCDVTVENGNGMRVAGAKLAGAFTFTP